MATPGFRDPAAAEAFDAAYERALATWPAGTEQIEVPTDLGTTCVHVTGPADAPPIVLIPGAGATAMTWSACVGPLAEDHRVIAPDVPGQAGRSTVVAERATGAEAVTSWLDQLIVGLGADGCALVGHSYGAWLCLYAALGLRARCASLVLVDPTGCFVDQRAAFRIRAVPVFVRPGPGTMRSFVAWESHGRPLEPRAHDVLITGAAHRGVGTEVPRLPNRRALEALTTPMLVVAAGRSRQQDAATLLASASATGTNVSTATIPGATHFSVPGTDAGPLVAAVTGFLAERPGAA